MTLKEVLSIEVPEPVNAISAQSDFWVEAEAFYVEHADSDIESMDIAQRDFVLKLKARLNVLRSFV